MRTAHSKNERFSMHNSSKASSSIRTNLSLVGKDHIHRAIVQKSINRKDDLIKSTTSQNGVNFKHMTSNMTKSDTTYSNQVSTRTTFNKEASNRKSTNIRNSNTSKISNKNRRGSAFSGQAKKSTSKKLTIVSKSRFALSMTLILVFILSTSMIAFATFDGKTDNSKPANALLEVQDTVSEIPLTYTVKSGDTLWSIASNINKEHYKQEKDIRKIVYAIRKANDLKGNTIYSGQTLTLPL